MEFYDKVITVNLLGDHMKISRELATALYLDGEVLGENGQVRPVG